MARAVYVNVPEHLMCQQPNGIKPLGSLIGGRGNSNCSRRAKYVDEHGYRYCIQHAKEPATTTRKATGKIREGLMPMRSDGTAFGSPKALNTTTMTADTPIEEWALKKAHKALRPYKFHNITYDEAVIDAARALQAERAAAETKFGKPAYDAALANLRDLHTALRMIRDAVQEIGPVAAVRERDVGPPDPMLDAEEIISGIQAIADVARRDGYREGIAKVAEAFKNLPAVSAAIAALADKDPQPQPQPQPGTGGDNG